jgi:hypothetical protein
MHQLIFSVDGKLKVSGISISTCGLKFILSKVTLGTSIPLGEGLFRTALSKEVASKEAGCDEDEGCCGGHGPREGKMPLG